MYALDSLTKHLASWEDKGWTNISNKQWFQVAAYQLRKRVAPTYFKWVKGHSGNHRNKEVDHLANEGATKNILDVVDTTVPDNFTLQGIKLLTTTQALVYSAITLSKTSPCTALTNYHLHLTRREVHNLTTNLKIDPSIWCLLRHPDICHLIQMFLYRVMHNSLKIGKFWLHIKNLEQRAKCTLCEAVRDVIFLLLLLSLVWGAGRKSPRGEVREREEKLLASGTPRAGLCHSRTSASACVLRLSSKSSCPEFT